MRPKHRIEYTVRPDARRAGHRRGRHRSRRLWQRLGKGDAIQVAYRSADPSDHQVEGTASDWVVALVLALVGGFFAPVGFWVARNGLRGEGADQPVRAVRWINDNPPFALGSIGLAFFLIFAVAGVWWATLASEESAEFASRAQAVEGMVIEKSVVRKSAATSSTGGARSGHSTHYPPPTAISRTAWKSSASAPLTAANGSASRSGGRSPRPTSAARRGSIASAARAASGYRSGPPSSSPSAGSACLAAATAFRRGWLRRGDPLPRQPKARPPQPAPAQPAAPTPPAKPGGNWIVVLVGAVFFAAGSSLAVSGLLDLLEERRFEAAGQLVEARIVDKGIQQADARGAPQRRDHGHLPLHHEGRRQRRGSRGAEARRVGKGEARRRPAGAVPARAARSEPPAGREPLGGRDCRAADRAGVRAARRPGAARRMAELAGGPGPKG